jgi:hypothetical protein
LALTLLGEEIPFLTLLTSPWLVTLQASYSAGNASVVYFFISIVALATKVRPFLGFLAGSVTFTSVLASPIVIKVLISVEAGATVGCWSWSNTALAG